MSGGPGQLLTAVVGAVIGFAIGGPVGASIGWSLGSMAGGIIFKADGGTQQGPRLNDRAAQTSSYGVAIPRVYGAFRLAGNVIWAPDIREKADFKRVGKSLFSKGTKVWSYTYSGSFAVLVCAGPVSALGRIWADGKLIHDPYTEGKHDSLIRKYLGGEDQLPDPAIQADQGIANTPAFRGSAYIVFDSLPLADFGNRIPTIHVEVGGQPISAAYQVGTVPNLGNDNWSYDPVVPGKVANSGSSYATVIDTATLAAIQVQPYYVAGVADAMIAFHGAIYGGVSLDNTDYSAPHILPPSNDLLVVLQGTTFRAGLVRLAASGSYATMVYAIGKGVSQGAGESWLFGSHLFMVDQARDYLYSYAVGDGSTAWTRSLSGTGNPDIVFNTSAKVAASYRASDGVIFYACSPSASNHALAWIARVGPTGTILTTRAGFWSHDAAFTQDIAITYDATTASLLVLRAGAASGTVIRLDPDTLATIGTPYPIAAWDAGAQTANFGTGNAVAGSLWLQNNGNTLTQYSTADLSVLWSGTVPADVSANLGDPFHIEAAGRKFFGKGTGSHTYQFGTIGTASNLGAIIADICDRCGLDADRIDVSDVSSQQVTGYCIGRTNTGRASLEPLMSAFAVDAPERDGKLVFQFRRTVPLASLTRDMLGADGDTGAEVRVTEGRTQEVDLPAQVTVSYSSVALDYQTATQSHKRIDDTIEAGDPSQIEYPLVLTDDEANTLASRLLFLAWIERAAFSFSLPPRWLVLDAGDVVDLEVTTGEFATVLLTKVEIGGDGSARCEALATDALAYQPPAKPAVVPILPPAQVPPTVETMTPIVLDAPLLDDGDDSFGYYVGARGATSSWGGGEIYASLDGTTYDFAATVAEAIPFGSSVTALPYHTGALIDRTNTLRVSLPSGTVLESVTELSMLAGSNRLLLGAELLSFATATQIDATTWDLSILLRCQQGTEWAASHGAGERVVVVEDLISVEALIAGLNQTVPFKGVSYGEALEDVTAISVTNTGQRIRPLSPVHIRGVRDGSNNLSLTWVRRARVNADWNDGYEAPLDEAQEAYEIDILSGSTVLRTIAVSAAAASYSATDMTADGLSPGSPVTLKIYQLSSRVGRGHAGEATL